MRQKAPIRWLALQKPDGTSTSSERLMAECYGGAKVAHLSTQCLYLVDKHTLLPVIDLTGGSSLKWERSPGLF